MKILITGANGQLGKDFQKYLKQNKIDYIPTDSSDLDITNLNQIRQFAKENKNITHIINCAAYNAVDKAEEEWEKAYRINGLGVRNLALISNEINAELIHYSTDYVFSGDKGSKYTIYDTPNPINKYGESKALGEKESTLSHKRYLIRVSWVFGTGNTNFAKKVINWSKNKEELRIVDDEISSPTYTKDLVKATMNLINLKAYGTYHITNTPCSRYEWAEYILEKINWKGKLNKAKKEEFDLPAKRPDYAVLDNFGYKETTGQTMPDWKNATKRFLDELKEMGEI
jgi:dTDP-4-dehydrorhamnose reductase